MKTILLMVVVTFALADYTFGECGADDKKALEAFDHAWSVAGDNGDRGALLNILADDFTGMPMMINKTQSIESTMAAFERNKANPQGRDKVSSDNYMISCTPLTTGATGGIGEATAKRFLDEGASVMLVARSKAKLNATRERLSAQRSLADFVADAADEEATAAAVAETVEAFGGVDILVANAGTEGNFAPIENLSLGEFESVLRTNVIGVWLAMKYCVEPMRNRGGGSILALSSIAGMIGAPTMAPYIASKTRSFWSGKNGRARIGSFQYSRQRYRSGSDRQSDDSLARVPIQS